MPGNEDPIAVNRPGFGGAFSFPMNRWVFLAVGVLMCLCVLYQFVAGTVDRLTNPPPGKFIEVAGLRMHLVCTGQGSPTVVLDSGLSDTWLHWFKVQPDVAKFTRVCSFDRAGLGYSDPRPGPRTSRAMAAELHALLHNAGIAPPYVLAGHSLGGLNSLMYASLYPDDVSGMVLVDSAHPDQYRRFPEFEQAADEWRGRIEQEHTGMIFGIPRIFGKCGTALHGQEAAFRAFDCTAQQKAGALAEMDGFAESLDQVRHTGPLGDMPLIVVSEAPTDPTMQKFLAAWYPLQDELAQRSSRGRRVVAQGAGHQIAQDRPDVVIAAIGEVVGQVRGE